MSGTQADGKQQKQEDCAIGPLKRKGLCLQPNGACGEVRQKAEMSNCGPGPIRREKARRRDRRRQAEGKKNVGSNLNGGSNRAEN